jgi:hypothetical protein
MMNQISLEQKCCMLVIFYEMKGASKTIGVGFCDMAFVLTGMQ